jgi:uncharacterized protein
VSNRSLPTISKATARRIAIASLRLGTTRPVARGDRRHARRVINHLGLLQIDSVNVLVRAHEMPLWSRIGDHDRTVLSRMAAGGELFEYWGHEASLIPVDDEPLYRWRMQRARDGIDTWGGVARLRREQPALIEEVHRRVRAEGPLTAADLRDGPASTEPWWGWDATKIALEYLFWCGDLSAVRGPTFERRYDVRERMLPERVITAPTPSEEDAHRELLRRAARNHGIGWAADLADFYRIRVPAARPRLAELVEAGELTMVRVDGIDEPAYLSRDAARPRSVRGASLLSPFDPLVWNRTRVERLFDFRYRIEIYVPASKRIHGYYVLPFLLGDRLVARVDLKADRRTSTLLVPAVFHEPGAPTDETAIALADELRSIADWLALDRIAVGRRGNLASALRATAGRSRTDDP